MDINVLHGDEAIDLYEAAIEEFFDMDGQGLALQTCLVRHYEALRRSLASRLGCDDLAMECLHDTWLRLASCAPRQPVRDSLAYIYRVAYHRAVDRMRGEGAERCMDYPDDLLQAVIDPAPGPDAIVQARSDARELALALQQLPYRHGYVLYALRVEEKTRQEVADWLCVSVRNVDTMLRQTDETLRARRGNRSERAMLACLAREASSKAAWQTARSC